MTTDPKDISRQKELRVNALYTHFFGDPELNVYAVLDGASIPDLLEHLEAEAPEHVCLYRGELSEDLASAAPYLVHLLPDTPFTEWLLLEGWGNHWGIFVLARGDLKSVRKHFRSFLLVKDPEGRQLYFRFYDPRVLRVFIPIATAEQTAEITGPLETLFFEAEDGGNMLSISRHSNWRLENAPLTGRTL